MSKNWTNEEVTMIVRDYFDMLTQELARQGQEYNKSEHRRNIQNLLNDRSDGSIEFKHQNISAVLVELGLPYIPGYKPRVNYQHLLKDTVEDYLAAHPELEDVFYEFVLKEVEAPEIANMLDVETEVPEMTLQVKEPSSDTKYRIKRNYYKEELRNRRLGLLGEEFVISYEKQRLSYLGLESLTEKIEHISQTRGDSAGFDILSFDKSGKEKLIEVKTTQLGKESPFYFTRNELGLSKEESSHYHLFRVFNFRKDPRFYQLKGALDQSCESISTEFMGWPK